MIDLAAIPIADFTQKTTIRLISTAYIDEPALSPLADNDDDLSLLEEVEMMTSARQNSLAVVPIDVDPDELLSEAHGFGWTYVNAAFCYTRSTGNRFNAAERGAWYACYGENAARTCQDDIAHLFEQAHDDFSAILFKALADRLAEALAEALHKRVRREFWGYAPDESFENADLIAEQYQGIRPAPGYPAQPDHTEKKTLFELLNVEQAIGVNLTESYAMWPGAAVCGLYFSHPDARYFGLGKIARDQVEDYAKRKAISLVEAEKWLGPNLGYEPSQK